MTNGRPAFPIVGVGASAGGVEALEGLFQGVPPQARPGVHRRHPPQPRARERAARDHRALHRPDRGRRRGRCEGRAQLRLCPARRRDHQHRQAGGLSCGSPIADRRERKPIDILFSSLAMDQGEYAAGVVLSGGDGDGTLGIKAIKERGGLTLAQVADGHGPRHPSMPDSAISTGLVDFAIPVEEMGAKLAEFARLSGDKPTKASARKRSARQPGQEICAILRNQIGHDFSGYKSKTFLRRVQRRMQVTQLGQPGRLCRAAAAGPQGGRRPVPRPADQRDQLLPRRRGLRDAAARWSSPSCSRAAAPTTRCASGCRAARPARRSTPSPSCCASTWTP